MPKLARFFRLAGSVATLLFVFLLGIGEARDPDLGFHLAIGRLIRATGRILDHNPFTFIEPSPAWVLPQGVAVAIFDWIVDKGGIGALIVFKAALVACTFTLLFRLALRLGASVLATGLAVLLASLAVSMRFVERPLLFSNLAFAFVMLGLVEARLAAGWRRWAWLGAVTLAMGLACQLHAGAVFSFFLLALVALSIPAERLRPRLGTGQPWTPNLGSGARSGWILAALAVSAAVLAAAILALYHPHPLRVLETPFVLGTDRFLVDHVAEFRPVWRFPFETFRAYWFLVVLGLAALIWGVRHLHAALLLVPLAFLLVSLRHARFIDLFAIALTPTLALVFTALFAALSGKRRVLTLVLLGTITVAGTADHITRTRLRLDYSPEVFAKAPLDFVQTTGLTGPTFVSDGWAGAFLERFYPKERVFFFAAFDAFLPEHYRDYMDIRYGKPGWDMRLDALGIEMCVLKYTSPTERTFQGGAPNLRQHLARDPRWALLYFDDNGEIFVRRAGKNAAPAAERGITGFDPDRMEWFHPSESSLKALNKLRENTRAPGRRLTWALESAREILSSRASDR
jgi:hypothetical protein